jgi:hypothetical protein
MAEQKIDNLDLKNKVDEYFKEEDGLLKRLGIKIHKTLNFPIYRELPSEVKLALLVLEKNGAEIVSEFELLPPEKKE